MKISNMGQTITIIAKERYTQEELFALLVEKGQFNGVPELKKILGIQNIVFTGECGYCNLVGVSKNKIIITQHKESAKGIGKSIGINALTGGWGSVLNVEGKQNATIMEAIGKEIERLVS